MASHPRLARTSETTTPSRSCAICHISATATWASISNLGYFDYTTFEYEHFDSRHQDLDQEEWWSKEGIVDAGWMVPLVEGYESGGREYFLNVLDGEVYEMILMRVDPGPKRLKVWIEEMQEDYRDLRLIPCPGRVTMDCTDVPERQDEDGRITEEQIRQQTEDWPTELDVQYVRQVYRDYGWPHAFRKDEAFAYMSQLLVSLEEENDDRYWEEKDFHDPR